MIVGYELILQLDSCEVWSKIILHENKMCNIGSAIQSIIRWCSSPVNLLHISRAPFYKNSYGGLLLFVTAVNSLLE